MTAVLDGPFTYAPPIPETATVAEISSQVTELLQVIEKNYKTLNLQELADLRERQGKVPRRRTVLDEPGKRRRKYEIETGILRDGTIRRPLEPWTCPGSTSRSMALYFRLMNGDVIRIADVKADDRPVLHWMAEQQLVAVDEHGQVLPLSDARAPKVRNYPGAPVGDKRAGIGAYLREHGRGIVLAALANISQGRSLRRSRKNRETITADGVAITAKAVCAEANRVKKLRDDLDGYRWLSLSLCRQIIRELIGDGVLDEISGPKAVRRERSWRMLPRIIKRLAGAPTPASPDPDHESRQESR